MAELLIEHKANVNKQNDCGETPLHLACFEEDEDMTKLLVANGADPNMLDEDGNTPYDLMDWPEEETPQSNRLTDGSVNKGSPVQQQLQAIDNLRPLASPQVRGRNSNSLQHQPVPDPNERIPIEVDLLWSQIELLSPEHRAILKRLILRE
mgnify:CR=1 FL=1